MRDQLRIGSASSWAAAWLILAAGSAAHLFILDGFSYLVALAAIAPIASLAVWRADKKGFDDPGAGPAGDGAFF